MKIAQEIEEMLNNGLPDGAEGPTKWPAMTYEQGVDAAVRWVLEWTADNPLGD